VNGFDDLAAIDALQLNEDDAEVAAPEFTLDDDQRHPVARHLDGLRVGQLVRRKATAPSCPGRGKPQVGASRRSTSAGHASRRR
jgi:hypothetical protein